MEKIKRYIEIKSMWFLASIFLNAIEFFNLDEIDMDYEEDV